MLLRFLFAAVFFFLFDLYVFKGIWVLSKNLSQPIKLIVYGVYWTISIIILLQFINIFSGGEDYRSSRPNAYVMWTGIFFTFFISKVFFAGFHLLDDIAHLIRWVSLKIFDTTKESEFRGESITRAKFLTQIGAGISVLALGLYTYGIVKGKFAFRIINEKMKFPNLPKSFVGTRIVHISDMHLGTFANQFEKIEESVKMINDLNPDYIFFTGDMVNAHANEAEPWIPVFNKLKAKKGMYSIFGNHDYCDYGNFTEQEKLDSIQKLKNIHKSMGFQLMEDQFVELKENNEKISLVGIHNWGKGFHQVGDLDNALQGIDQDSFKILLSHDPTLWEEKVMDKEKIDLTLSGHTHGMQMGLEIPKLNIKFSPIKLRYKRWAGLYSSSSGDQRIYINRGFGVLGFPGRVGMPPEITLIELETA